MTEKITSHEEGERIVRLAIKEGGDNEDYETFPGREDDESVALKMAHTARPYIDEVLERLTLPKNMGFADVEEEGRVIHGQPFGVILPTEGKGTLIDPKMREETYDEISRKVDEGYRHAKTEQRIAKREK